MEIGVRSVMARLFGFISKTAKNNHYWPWNEKVEEMKYKLRERKRGDSKSPRSNAKPKQKIQLRALKSSVMIQKVARNLGGSVQL